jgi:histidinol-phosphate aminotransferase
MDMSGRIRDAVERLAAYTPGEQPADRSVIKLNTNENPYPPSPRVVEAMRSFDPDKLRRYPDPMSLALRDTIASRHGCVREQVFAGNGSDEILALCTRAFVPNGGSVGYFDPSYSLYPVLADIQEAERRPVALAEDYGWRMPADYKASLFLLARPNAPTGISYPRAEIKAFCSRFDGVVVVDEAYADFASDNCMDMALSCPNVLVMRTVSKSFSLAGLRVGYVVGDRVLIDALYKIKDSYNLDALAQALALAAIRDTAYLAESAGRIRATRARLAAALSARRHMVYPSESNFLWVRPAGIAAARLYEELRQRRIFIRYFAGPRTGECVRITVGTDSEVDALLAAIDEICGRK